MLIKNALFSRLKLLMLAVQSVKLELAMDGVEICPTSTADPQPFLQRLLRPV